ncbi:MAG: VWA domain-containing protein [Bacteroidota bacterium]|nr:VWA domain-containing protein [Bacteroidota bacterium]
MLRLISRRFPSKTRILFLLDASGSMLAKMENELRMNVAKKLLSDLTDSLKVNPEVELALRVYGHQHHRRYQNCKDSKLEVPFKPGNHNLILSSLKKLEPQGNTPIAYSLQQSATDFPKDDNARNIIIIITDGLESCGGDPCDVSVALQEKRIFLKPFVIGIGMEGNFEKQFSCVGQYFDAKNISEFRSLLNKAIKQSLNKTTVTVDLLDIHEASTETDVNVTFVNNFTGQPVYDFIHYRDKKGIPDTISIDAVLSYDIVVNTIPPVYKKNDELEGGIHNNIKIKSPQGFLVLKQKGHTEYKEGVKVLVKKSSSSETINIQTIPHQEKYLVGRYDLEVLTLPRTYFKDVVINHKEVNVLHIPSPGILNISSGVPGFGNIYTVDKEGSQKWVCSMNDTKNQETFTIQPGDYKIVFRAKNAFGSKFTEIKNFTIHSGSTTSIKLYNR